MALRSLPYLLLLFRLYRDTIVSATTAVQFYTDASCKDLSATVQTDTDAGNGKCGEFATSINSARSIFIDEGCSVTTYTGLSFCNYNATNVPMGSCIDMSIGSFSVDCPQINGTYSPDYTTIPATKMSTRTSPLPSTSTSTPPVSTSPIPSSHQSSATETPSPHPSSSTTSSLPELPTSSLEDSRSSPSTTSQPPPPSSPSPSPSQASKGSGNDGGLSGPSTIAIEVVLPGVGVIVAIVFGVLGINRWKKENGRTALPFRRWSL